MDGSCWGNTSIGQASQAGAILCIIGLFGRNSKRCKGSKAENQPKFQPGSLFVQYDRTFDFLWATFPRVRHGFEKEDSIFFSGLASNGR